MSQRTPGLGIGLALVRKLVPLHDGTVEAESAGPGRGSTFVVRLPLAAHETPPEAPPVPAPPAGTRRVLIVEDHDDNREMLSVLVSMGGHHVHAAADGATGLAIALRETVDVALVDIGLPDIDGYEVARRIREARGRRVLLVALTGFGQPEDRPRAQGAGFDAHLVKPIRPDELAVLLAAGAPVAPKRA